MQLINEQRIHRPTRSRRFLHWVEFLFFGVAILALGYCGFTLLDAWSFQSKAKHFLADELQTQQKNQIGVPRTAFKEGDVLGKMEIPRIGMSVAVLEGTKSRILRLGVGHIEGTVLPGYTGNSGIAGHRDTFFRNLKGIRLNDEIRLQTASGLFQYRVDWVKVVEPDDMSVLEPSANSALTLVTCYPFRFLGAAPKRFVVHAKKQ
jgi:sortase A